MLVHNRQYNGPVWYSAARQQRIPILKGEEDMGNLLEWQNLVFYIPLTFGLLMIIGAAFGIGGDGDHDVDHDLDTDMDADADGDADHDLDHDHDHDHDADEGRHGGIRLLSPILSVLGVGKVPLSIVLMIAGCVFGGTGIVMNTVLAPMLVHPAAYAWISALVAFIVMTFVTGQLARLINRVMPTTESYNVTRADLCGRRGQLILAADEHEGLAIVKDHEGNVHNLHCRTTEGSLPKNSDVLVIDYEEKTNTYLVVPDPTSEQHDT